jgi:hypothetical protein
MRVEMFTCPVCAYDRLPAPPADFAICPCCGVEFEYDDATKSHAQLRSEWIAAGLKWFSRDVPPPNGWSGWKQLAKGGFVSQPISA